MKKYKLGDTYSEDFDFDGMLQKGTEANIDWPLKDLENLYDSFVDVNYHREGGYLYGAIQEAKAGHIVQAIDDLEDFNNKCKKTLTEFYKTWQ
tara:strand:+ start:870 stop:1148 length:279 start_codon:yes stop_codon:yes gene_type:complete